MSFRPVSSLYKLEFLISKIENIGLVYSARAFNVISALFCVKGCVETVTKSPKLNFGTRVLRSFAFILLIFKQIYHYICNAYLFIEIILQLEKDGKIEMYIKY